MTRIYPLFQTFSDGAGTEPGGIALITHTWFCPTMILSLSTRWAKNLLGLRPNRANAIRKPGI